MSICPWYFKFNPEQKLRLYMGDKMNFNVLVSIVKHVIKSTLPTVVVFFCLYIILKDRNNTSFIKGCEVTLTQLYNKLKIDNVDTASLHSYCQDMAEENGFKPFKLFGIQ